MENLFPHIERLLRRHDYVIVPELGGFAYYRQPAVISGEVLEPPVVSISFNPLMHVSDGLLAIEISRMEQVSFREATARIAQEVEALKAALRQRKNKAFGQLGTLSADADHKIIFTPAQNSHLIPANYGLNALHYAPLRVDSERRRIISFTLPSARKMARYAAIAVVAAGLFYAAPRWQDASANLANLFPLKQAYTLPAESATPAQPLQIAIPASDQFVETARQPAETLRHHVIVSCMATRGGADALCAELRQANFPKAHVLPPQKTFRVVAESFATQEAAIAYMEGLRLSTPRFSDAWVLSE